MNKIPYWSIPARGFRIGFAQFSSIDDYGARILNSRQIELVSRIHIKMLIAICGLDQFSTRDYAYDRGGMVVWGNEINNFQHYEWKRE